MIDLWEAIGRMATDAKFCSTILNLGAKGQRNFPKQVWAPADPGYKLGVLLLQDTDYDSLRTSIEAASRKPISLFALGEIFRALYFPSFAASMSQMPVVLAGKVSALPSRMALSAIGCMLVDSIWRDQVNTTQSLGVFGNQLNVTENAQLVALAANPAFGSLADAACSDGWDRICPVKYMNYSVPNAPAPFANHAHLDYNKLP